MTSSWSFKNQKADKIDYIGFFLTPVQKSRVGRELRSTASAPNTLVRWFPTLLSKQIGKKSIDDECKQQNRVKSLPKYERDESY